MEVTPDKIGLLQGEIHATVLQTSGTRVAIRPSSDSDNDLITRWLKKYQRHTARETSRADVKMFRAFIAMPLQAVTEDDIEAYADSLTGFAPSTQSRRLSAVKSLFAYGTVKKCLPFDVSADIPLPGSKDLLGERLLTVEEVSRLLAAADAPMRMGPFTTRNATMMRLIYGSGMRVSEACNVRWRDFAPYLDGGFMTVFGKGDRTRTVRLPMGLWTRVMALRGNSGPTDHVFRSLKGTGLVPIQVNWIFKSFVRPAGLPPSCSAHWLRHAHVSHALRNKAPVEVVRVSVGHSSLTSLTWSVDPQPRESSAQYIYMA
jgi:integrase/recombinase XerD